MGTRREGPGSAAGEQQAEKLVVSAALGPGLGGEMGVTLVRPAVPGRGI